MSAEQFLDWTLGLPDDTKYELLNGRPVAMAPQTYGHGEIKFRIAQALDAAVRAGRLPCRVMVETMGIRATARRVFIPDVIVHCGSPIARDRRLLEDPLVVVEVPSPSTRHIDLGMKFIGYFNCPSLRHYLLVDIDERQIVHHGRDGDGIITSRVHTESDRIHLDPPGIVLEGAFPPA